MATIGSTTKPVTLTPADRTTTLTGTINAYGTIPGFGAYRDAAIFGPAGTDYTLDNIGLIEGHAAGGADTGILLAAPGTIKNAGTIIDGTGIAILGANTSPLYLKNTGKIEASSTLDNTVNNYQGFLKYGVGVYAETAGRVVNTGTISGDHAGIAFFANPLSLAGTGTVLNSGLITSSLGNGILIFAGGSVDNTGTIIGYQGGINISGAATIANVTNTGFIEATAGTFTIGSYSYSSNAVFEVATGTIDNAAGGRIVDNTGYGIVLFAGTYNSADKAFLAGAGTILNAGTVSAEIGVLFYGIGGLKNTGKIIAQEIGFDATSPLANVYNAGLITVSDSQFADFGGGATYIATGVVLHNSGNVTNAATGTIAAPLGIGVFLTGPATVTNAGTITGADLGIDAATIATLQNSGFIAATGTQFTNRGTTYGDAAVVLHQGGRFTNAATGTIAAPLSTGVANLSGLATIGNAGTIDAEFGIIFGGAGSLKNTGKIIAGGLGVELTTSLVSGYNAGFISISQGQFTHGGTTYPAAAIAMLQGGNFTNAAAGTITAAHADAIAALAAPATISNAGKLAGIIGIYTQAGGTITNTGIIDAPTAGIIMKQGGTIIDTGTISIAATGFAAIYFKPGDTDRLVIDAATKITGTVDGGGGILELAADGTKIGTFTPAEEQQFGGFDSLVIDPKAIWAFTGNAQDQSINLTNNGTIDETGTDQLTIDQTLLGTGLIELDKTPLTLNGPVAAGQTLKFTGTAETLALGDSNSFAGKIDNFTLGDTIDVTDLHPSDITATHFAGGVLTLSESAGSVTITFASPASFGNDVFVLTGTAAGTAITLKKPPMTIQTPTTPPAATTLDPPPPIGATTTATPDPLSGLTMTAPFGIATALLHPTPTTLPAITLQP
jgi:hypothetical protein